MGFSKLVIKMKIIPVIHVIDFEQTYKNAHLCMQKGCDHFMLINMSIDTEDLLNTFIYIQTLLPEAKIGLNLLGYNSFEAMKYISDRELTPYSIWSDSAGIRNLDDLIFIQEVTNYKKENKFIKDSVYFGGVDFKYQKPIDINNKEAVYKESMKHMDVITTSGIATGKAPTTYKIEQFRKAIGDFPLAIASGINVDNINSFSKLVDYGLVASSITDYKTELIQENLFDNLLNKIV